MAAILKQLAKLDLSPIVPKKYRARAKAIGAGILGLIPIAVQLAIIDAPTGAIITSAVADVLLVIGVHQTTNAK